MRRIAVILLAVSLTVGSAPTLVAAQARPPVTAPAVLSSLADVVSGLAPDADEAVFEAQMAGVIEQSGATASVAIEALTSLRASPKVSANAIKAIDALIEALKARKKLRVRSIDGLGRPVGDSPSFSSGGGGSDYSS